MCRPVYCVIRHNPLEVDEAQWVPKKELPGLDMPDGARYILGKIFPELKIIGKHAEQDEEQALTGQTG